MPSTILAATLPALSLGSVTLDSRSAHGVLAPTRSDTLAFKRQQVMIAMRGRRPQLAHRATHSGRHNSGDVNAHLFASTTGSDADWIAKLIDVYLDSMPEPKMGGYELMVALKPAALGPRRTGSGGRLSGHRM